MSNLISIGDDARLKMAENANQSIIKNNLNNLSPLQRLKKVFEREAEEGINKSLKSMFKKEKIALALTRKYPVPFYMNEILEQTPEELCRLLPEFYSLNSNGEAHYYLSKDPGGVKSLDGGFYTHHRHDPMSGHKFYLFDALKVHKCNNNYKDTIKYLYEHRTELNIPEELFNVSSTSEVMEYTPNAVNSTDGVEFSKPDITSGFVTYSLRDLFAEVDCTKPQECLFLGCFPKGEISFAYGKGSSGKSTFLTNLFLRFLSQKELADVSSPLPQGSRLLWFSNEETISSMAKRFFDLLEDNSYSSVKEDLIDRVHISFNQNCTTKTYLAQLEKEVALLRQKDSTCSLSIVIDPFSGIMFKDMNFNDNGAVRELGIAFSQLIIKYNIDYFIIIDHTNKVSESKNQMKNTTAITGANAKSQMARCAVCFERKTKDNTLVLTITKENYFDSISEQLQQKGIKLRRTDSKVDYELIETNEVSSPYYKDYSKLDTILNLGYDKMKEDFEKDCKEEGDMTMLRWLTVSSGLMAMTQSERDLIVKHIRTFYKKRKEEEIYEKIKQTAVTKKKETLSEQ